MTTIIALISKNWKLVLYGIIGLSFALYIIIIKYDIDRLERENQEYKQTITNQRVAYDILQANYQLAQNTVESYNRQLNDLGLKYDDSQKQILNYKTQLDRTNHITDDFLRLASGQQLSSPSITTSTVNAKTESAKYVQPSATASGIRQYVQRCEQITAQLNALIDYNIASVNNYNKAYK